MISYAIKSLVLCFAVLSIAGCSHDTTSALYDSSTEISSTAIKADGLPAAEAALAAKGFRPYPSIKTKTDLDLWYYRNSGDDDSFPGTYTQTIQVRGLQNKRPGTVRVWAGCSYDPPIAKHPKMREAQQIAELEDARRSVLDALVTNSRP